MYTSRETWYDQIMPATNMTRPIRFQGTRAEALANQRTHDWTFSDDGLECNHCGTRNTHAAASYPCGAEVPRETVQV